MQKRTGIVIMLQVMSGSLLDPKKPGWLHSSLASSQFKNTRQGFNKSIDFLLIIEPWWVLLLAITLVFSSYLLQIGPAFLPWIGLTLCFLPFPLRWARQGILRLRTPFDLPIALLIAGALMGLIVSPKLSLSLGVFQCILATSLFYYSWVNYHRLATLMKWLIPMSILSVLGLIIFAYVEWNQSLASPDSWRPTYHGLALSLIIIAAIFSGVAIFSKGAAAKVICGLICLAIVIGGILLVEDSLSRLFAGVSISERMTLLWGETISMLGDSPLSGLGLGCWALTYYGTDLITHPTHAHNAYLELYSNAGFLGALAFIIALIIGLKLAINIVRSPRTHPWYGFGIGVLLACLATIIVGIVESSPIGVPLLATDTYYYFISPAPLILVGFLVSAHRLLSKNMP